ncbi:MAG: hypothetical protein EOO36_22955 [Cytophagaceae bacterium]|nr:MAG: hypothetical protein EOO36_22955 [Cytophagaceae bacterium]
MEVGPGSTLILSEQAKKKPALYIGPGAQLVVKKGGTLELQPHTKVTIAGQLIVEEGAHFDRSPLAEVQQLGTDKLRAK